MHQVGGSNKESQIISNTSGALKSPQKLRSLIVASGQKYIPNYFDSYADNFKIEGLPSVTLVIVYFTALSICQMILLFISIFFMTSQEQSETSALQMQIQWSNLVIYFHQSTLLLVFFNSYHKKYYLSCSQISYLPGVQGTSGFYSLGTFLQQFYLIIPTQSSFVQIKSSLQLVSILNLMLFEKVPDIHIHVWLKDFIVVIFVKISSQNIALSLDNTFNTLPASSHRVTDEVTVCSIKN